MDAVDYAIQVLNEALQADPVAIECLFNVRVEVNTNELRDHPTIQVGTLPAIETGVEGDQRIWLRPLGLINGLFGVDAKSLGFIAMSVDDNGDILGFVNRVQ